MNEYNVYYNPDKFGLHPIAEIGYSSGSYEFDIRIVWQHESGRYYTARDSGCSCPTPFENFAKIEDLEDYSFAYIRDEALQLSRGEYYQGESVQWFIDKLPR